METNVVKFPNRKSFVSSANFNFLVIKATEDTLSFIGCSICSLLCWYKLCNGSKTNIIFSHHRQWFFVFCVTSIGHKMCHQCINELKALLKGEALEMKLENFYSMEKC